VRCSKGFSRLQAAVAFYAWMGNFIYYPDIRYAQHTFPFGVERSATYFLSAYYKMKRNETQVLFMNFSTKNSFKHFAEFIDGLLDFTDAL
jgi:hypothetical protein